MRRPLRGVTTREVLRIGPGGGDPLDEVVVEEPLEIRVAGEPLAVTLRTPGHDRQLALGFLFAEGVLHSADDVGSLAHCGRPGAEGYGNVIDVIAAAGAVLDVERPARRGTMVTAACGVCGRVTIDDLLARCGRLPDGPRFEPDALASALLRMREAQALFARTGGIHAAGAFDAEGHPLAIHEDVGRHNAVDKVVGELLLANKVPARASMLIVSGRAGFEIVQKAIVAGIPVVASVSASSSLAIDLADKCNVTLAAFVRDGRFNVYTGAHRLGL